jgi:uncharacterized protein DUF5666
MLDKLSLLLKSKIALAAVGATLVAGGGASVAAAATGAHVPVISQALHAATGTHDANDDKGQAAAGHDANDDKGHDGATATPGAGHDANDDNGQDANDNDANDDNGQDANDADDANEFEATGSVVSVDASGSSFMLKQSDGSTIQVTASSSTVFDGGLTKVGDLKAGMAVEVKGAKQSDGSVAASRVHGEDVNDDHSGSGSAGSDSGSGSSGGSGTSGGSGSGSSGSGSDDGHGGNG